MPNAKTSIRSLGEIRGQKSRRRQCRNVQPSESARHGCSPSNQSKMINQKYGRKDVRFDIPTANRFEALNKPEDKISHVRQEKGIQRTMNDLVISADNQNISGMRLQLPIFTVEHLDKQISVFNLTKYAIPNWAKALSLSGSASLSSDPSEAKSDLKSVSSPTYIPPHRRSKHQTHTANPNDPLESKQPNPTDKPVNIIIKDVEEAWFDCKKKGVFAIWTGPVTDIHPLINWLADKCQEQVSIFHHHENVLFLKCEEEAVKKEFIAVSECFFKGFCVKFVEWIPNFHIDKMDCVIPLWFSMNLPPELCDVDIIYEIGAAIGVVIAIDASFFRCNSIKMLINLNIKHPSVFQKKIITKKATYDISFQEYKGKITDILKSERKNNHRTEVLPLTTNFKDKFPGLSSKLIRRNKHSEIHQSEIHIVQKEKANQKAPSGNNMPDETEGTLINPKVDLRKNTRVMRTGVKDLKGTRKYDNKHKNNSREVDGFKNQFLNDKGEYIRKTKELIARQYKEKSKVPEQSEILDKADSRVNKEIFEDQVSPPSEMVLVNHTEKEIQDDSKGKEQVESANNRVEANNREDLEQSQETLCESVKIWNRDHSLQRDIRIYEDPLKYIDGDNKEDGNEESKWEVDKMKRHSNYSGQEEFEGKKETDRQEEIYYSSLEIVDNQDLGEAENDMLFSSPKVGVGKTMSRAEEKDSQPLNIISEAEFSTPQIEGGRRTSKFWQTPDGHYSPFTPEETQTLNQINGKSIEVSISKDLQQFLNEDLESTPKDGLSELEVKNLEQLSEELIKVFDFDNLDNSTSSQKERLIQKIIKLGGEDYTAEDLQRDLIKIQLEDRARKPENQNEEKLCDIQEGKQTKKGEKENETLEKDSLGHKICQELEMEEFERSEEGICPTGHELGILQQELGIAMNQEGLTTPNYGKPKAKRGRRSLKDLRETEGLAREQRKIDELLNMGKGKDLPKST